MVRDLPELLPGAVFVGGAGAAQAFVGLIGVHGGEEGPACRRREWAVADEAQAVPLSATVPRAPMRDVAEDR